MPASLLPYSQGWHLPLPTRYSPRSSERSRLILRLASGKPSRFAFVSQKGAGKLYIDGRFVPLWAGAAFLEPGMEPVWFSLILVQISCPMFGYLWRITPIKPLHGRHISNRNCNCNASYAAKRRDNRMISTRSRSKARATASIFFRLASPTPCSILTTVRCETLALAATSRCVSSSRSRSRRRSLPAITASKAGLCHLRTNTRTQQHQLFQTEG